MTIDTKIIADLPACSRRVFYRATANSPLVIYCKPLLAQLQQLPPAELIKHPELYKQKIVTYEICSTCQELDKNLQIISQSEIQPIPIPKPISVRKPQLLKDGTIVYTKEETDWEPPPVPVGYRRKSNNPQSSDAWILIPEKPFCIYIEFEKRPVQSCGCERYFLNCVKDGKKVLILREEICQNCPYKVDRL
jgi:hypothetical protein